MKFPAAFQWGTATAAPQIEGGAYEDGKGESIWDRFGRSGKVLGGPNAFTTASDHYHRWAEDVQAIADMGLNTYRFSVAWPRIFPQGRGTVNQKGLDFYRRLIAALRAKGIQPAVTLYHWDLPQALQDHGGWLNRDTAQYFADYAATLFREFGSDVPLWFTLNEPFIATVQGHLMGVHAPGLRRPFSAMQAAHHMLLGHGLAVKAFRQLAPAGAQIGLTNFLWQHEPLTDSPADAAAAWRGDGMISRWYCDPVFKGHYPEEIWRWFSARFMVPKVREGDFDIIAAPTDFLGVQYYSRFIYKSNRWNPMMGFNHMPPTGEVPVTAMGNEVYPDGLYKLLVRLHGDYKVPLIVTENGVAFGDQVTPEGRVHDQGRIAYLQEHIRAVGRAMAAGADVRGYYVWSLMDNVEWHQGTSMRFGLLHVDFDSQQRTWKDSACWLRDFIQGGAELPDA